MSTALREPTTLAAFLEWEERQERPFEFDGFQPVAMNGGTIRHDELAFNVRAELKRRLRGGCRPYGPNTKIIVGGEVRYPDALVSCVRQDALKSVVEKPVVVFEIISESSGRIDRIDKVREYQAEPSIQRYVILEQTRVAATVFERRGDVWAEFSVMDGGVLSMLEIGVELPLAAFYAGIEMPNPI